MEILIHFWELIVGGLALLAAAFYRHRAKSAEQRAKTAERVSETYKDVLTNEREAMQLDDVSLADRITRKQ